MAMGDEGATGEGDAMVIDETTAQTAAQTAAQAAAEAAEAAAADELDEGIEAADAPIASRDETA